MTKQIMKELSELQHFCRLQRCSKCIFLIKNEPNKTFTTCMFSNNDIPVKWDLRQVEEKIMEREGNKNA